MDMNSLTCFLRVCELRNFTKAAQELHITQPALSRRILALEDEIEAKLLNRSSTGITMTAGGRAFYDEAKKLVALQAALEDKMKKYKRGCFGKIVIGHHSSNFVQPLLFAAQTMKEDHPDIEMEFVELSKEELIHKYGVGEIDVAYGFKEDIPKPSNSVIETIAKNHITILIPKGHRLWGKTSVTSADLTEERFVLVGRETRMVERVLRLYEDKGISFADSIDCPSTIASLFMVATDGYIGLDGKYTADYPKDFAEYIQSIPLTDIETDIADMCVAYRPSNDVAERFVNCMRSFDDVQT